MAVHKDCYTSLNLTQQGGLRRRETVRQHCYVIWRNEKRIGVAFG